MSKAILVMDMPSKCNKCLLLDDEYDLCIPTGEDVSDYQSETKPDWCPLREVPQKADFRKAKTETVANWIEGYNSCIDTIIKERME